MPPNKLEKCSADWCGEDRRKNSGAKICLTDDQLDEIAERAAEKAVEKMQAETFRVIGKSIVERGFAIVGILFIGFFFWLKSKGLID